MTSFSENAKYVNKNCKYDPSNYLGNSHECHFLWTTRYVPGKHLSSHYCTMHRDEVYMQYERLRQYHNCHL